MHLPLNQRLLFVSECDRISYSRTRARGGLVTSQATCDTVYFRVSHGVQGHHLHTTHRLVLVSGGARVHDLLFSRRWGLLVPRGTLLEGGTYNSGRLSVSIRSLKHWIGHDTHQLDSSQNASAPRSVLPCWLSCVPLTCHALHWLTLPQSSACREECQSADPPIGPAWREFCCTTDFFPRRSFPAHRKGMGTAPPTVSFGGGRTSTNQTNRQWKVVGYQPTSCFPRDVSVVT